MSSSRNFKRIQYAYLHSLIFFEAVTFYLKKCSVFSELFCYAESKKDFFSWAFLCTFLTWLQLHHVHPILKANKVVHASPRGGGLKHREVPPWREKAAELYYSICFLFWGTGGGCSQNSAWLLLTVSWRKWKAQIFEFQRRQRMSLRCLEKIFFKHTHILQILLNLLLHSTRSKHHAIYSLVSLCHYSSWL